MENDDEQRQVAGKERVGYGRPPRGTQFKKGQSGNPRGRPKGSLNVSSVLRKVLREKVIINENGKRKVVTKLEASGKQLVNQAASGKFQAMKHLFELAQAVEDSSTASGHEAHTHSEVDQEVIQGILKRLSSSHTESTVEKKEPNPNDTERS